MKRILVAEDDPDVSGLVRTLLEAAGHEVQVVEDGEKALESFQKDGFDLVVLDVLLPGRNGFQVAESIRAGEQGADVPIVMLSGVYRGPTYRTQARRRFGAVEYLEKPVEVDRLLQAVLQGFENPRPRFQLDGEPDDEPTEMSQGLPPLPSRGTAAKPEPKPEPQPEPEPASPSEVFTEETAASPATAENFDPVAPTQSSWEDESASSVAATEPDPSELPDPDAQSESEIETASISEGEPEAGGEEPATENIPEAELASLRSKHRAQSEPARAAVATPDPDSERYSDADGSIIGEDEADVETGATTTDRPPQSLDLRSPAPEDAPPGGKRISVRSLAASARALAGGDPEASAPSIPTPRVRAPRPSSGMKAVSFDPEHVGHTDRLLSALKSGTPESTDSKRSAPPPRASDRDESLDGAFSLGQLPPAPDLRTTLEPEEPEPAHAEPDGTVPIDEAGSPYADPESLREKRMVERSLRVTRGAAQGDLRHTPFPVLLHRLFKERVSGALLLVKDPVKKIVYFRDGLPVFVKSNLLSECLGKVLVRERLISDAQCRESLRLLQETKRQQGSLLIQMGALSDANLTYGLQLQLRTKLYEIFSWSAGEYRLSTRTRPPMETAMLESSIEEILFDGIRASFDPERLRSELEPCVDLYLAVAKGAGGRISAMPLQAPDRAVVSSINGGRTVRDILARAPAGPGSAAQLVYALLCAELVETRTQPSASSSAPVMDAVPATTTTTDGDGRALATQVSTVDLRAGTPSPAQDLRAGTPAPAQTLDDAVGPATVPTATPSSGALMTPGEDPPPQTTAELMAEPDLPILPASDLDALVENTLAAELQFQKAEAYIAGKRWDEAVRALQKANALCPEQPDFLATLGWALFCARGEAAADEALAEIAKALEASPRFDRAFLLRGFVWKAMGAIDDAVRDFEEALACNPDSVEARRELEGLRPLHGEDLRR